MIANAKEIFQWAKKVKIVSEDIGIVYCEGMEVALRYGGWGHPYTKKGFYREGESPAYWSRLFLDNDRTFRYLVGFKYMPKEVITISNPEELAECSEDYVSKLHSHCLGDGTHG